MIITEEWLESQLACPEGVKFVKEARLISLPADKFVKELIKLKQFDYARWILPRILGIKERVKLVMYLEKNPLSNNGRAFVDYLLNPLQYNSVSYAEVCKGNL